MILFFTFVSYLSNEEDEEKHWAKRSFMQIDVFSKSVQTEFCIDFLRDLQEGKVVRQKAFM